MYRMLLVADPTFRSLNIPIPQDARKEMDRKIKKGETVDPIISWNGYILTGYEQDEICLKYHRHYAATKEMIFPRKSDAIAWLCHQQLKRTDIIWTAKAWLISRLYEALRDIAKRQAAKEEFEYRQLCPSTKAAEPAIRPRESITILKQIGIEYNYHRETIRRYVRFGRQLDKLEEAVPGIRVRILTGDLGVMMCHMPALVKMPADQLRKMSGDRYCRQLIPLPQYLAQNTEKKRIRQKKDILVKPGIKQMPKYDPDAELNGLKYTIGAWRKAIARTAVQADLSRATAAGKEELKQVLDKLIQETEGLSKMLEGKQDD